jgi:hypothetical protein
MCEPKYEINKPVYFKAGDSIKELEPVGIKKVDGRYKYFTPFGAIDESNLYPTRESLINAEIAHWESLR